MKSVQESYPSYCVSNKRNSVVTLHPSWMSYNPRREPAVDIAGIVEKRSMQCSPAHDTNIGKTARHPHI